MGAAPSWIWDPNRPMPKLVLDHFVKMKEYYGLHVYYPFGWLNDMDIALPRRYSDGLTFRSWWFFGHTGANSRITLYEEGQLDNTYVVVKLDSGSLSYKVSSGGPWTPSGIAISQGYYYCIAIQMVEDRTFKILCDDKSFCSWDIRISGRKWRVQIKPATNYIFALQYTYELKSFPPRGLGSSFWFAGMKLQVGTSVHFQGQVLRFKDTDVIEAKFGPPDLKISFKSGPKYEDKIISFILKRTVTSFLLVMDFTTEGAVRSTPTREPYKSGGIHPVFSHNFRLLRTYVGWGSFTS